MKKLLSLILIVITFLLITMLDVVFPPGDHVSFLVLAPYPTVFEFVHYGGESVSSWQRKNPKEKLPWWILGEYIVLMETTNG